MRHVFRKTTRGMSAADDKGRAAWAKLGDGDLFFVEMVRQRHAENHRLYWATVGFFAKHSERSPEIIHTLFKDLTGRYDLVEKRDGEKIRHYHSISYASMDEDEFTSFHGDLIDALWREVMPDVPEGRVREELQDLLKDRYRRQE